MPSFVGRRGGRPAVAHLELDLGRERDVAAGVADQQPLVVEQVRGVDVGRVRVEQVEVLEPAQLALRVAEAVHRDVDGDVDAQLLGELPLVAHDVGLAEVRAARGEGHRDQALVVAQVLAADPARLVAVDPLDAAAVVRPEPPVLDRRVGEAEREDRADAGVLEALDGGVGVVRRVHDVRPVDERRDARVDALERAPLVARRRRRPAGTSARTGRGSRRSRRPACSPARRSGSTSPTCGGGCRRSPG